MYRHTTVLNVCLATGLEHTTFDTNLKSAEDGFVVSDIKISGVVHRVMCFLHASCFLQYLTTSCKYNSGVRTSFSVRERPSRGGRKSFRSEYL